MRLHVNVAAKLRKTALEAEKYPGREDLDRLIGYAGRMEALAEEMKAICLKGLPVLNGEIRLLSLARELVAAGESQMNEDALLERIGELEGRHVLEMAEVMHMPSALRIALCEAWADRAGIILRQARERQKSQENEGWRMERELRLSAENCVRLDNLMALKQLLDGLDWQECFEKLCTAEKELLTDAVYAGMDEESRGAVRLEAAWLARRFAMDETELIRRALELAEETGTTVCAYFYTDAGREMLRKRFGKHARLKKLVPDAEGRRTVWLLGLLTLALAMCFAWIIENAALAIYALPLAWAAAMALSGRFYPHFVKPQRLLKMELAQVGNDARTLVALPVLLSCADRAREMLARMEALGCMEKDENIDFLLLGDFRDSENPDAEDDEAILSAVRKGIADLNRRAERKKYYYLQRGRNFRERDGRWMGKNRKRGALMALNRLILGLPSAEFDAEGGDGPALAGRYRYVVTLDADTRYLPGTLQKLVGAMIHPLNSYAVLQPAMRMAVDACANEYVRMVYAEGGLDAYPVTVSDFYQDVCGRGCFAGKGIYDVAAFHRATEGKLQDENILSHDLIEGILAGAGFVNDVFFYDACPDNLAADLSRSHRWTRGDWQLLPVLAKPGIAAVDRLKMIGNLLRSLHAPALLGLLVHSLWLDAPRAFALGLLLAFLAAVLRPLDRAAWRRGLLELALLPVWAKTMLDAIFRTLWRLAVSKKHLMEWVPAADAASEGKNLRMYGRMAAILLLPGLLSSFWIPAALALGGLFFIGVDWAEDLRKASVGGNALLSGAQINLLQGLAAKTWHFFEYYVPEDGSGLPPDNVQMDPPIGIARRTSPTNIGLYLLACLSAHRMGFIRWEACEKRLEQTLATLERMEKWQGQLYNWYDIDSLRPLHPSYVSSVDSGNLAACLLLCAQAMGECGLSHRFRKLAEGMNLAALYDEKRGLFHIGMDTDSGEMSRSYYDLYASESRILSFAAMMMGQVPLRHWQRLARPARLVGKDAALMSWSGTMFEYLMPEIFFQSAPNSLAGQCVRAVQNCQQRYSREMGRPWGVSESGHYAFDLEMNYQYRAFGLRQLSLSGEGTQDVVAPYASVLALCCAPAEAAKNIAKMMELGWQDEFGLYEAADYLHPDTSNAPRLVKSHMAHHQGMILGALCNALAGNYLSDVFKSIPQAKALDLLLQERPVAMKGRQKEQAVKDTQAELQTTRIPAVIVRGDLERTHLLHGSGVTAAVRGDGAVFTWADGMQLNRFSGDLCNFDEGMYVHLKNLQTGETLIAGKDGQTVFEGGSARFEAEKWGVQVRTELLISPEDGTLYQTVELHNTKREEMALELTGCLAVALAKRKDMLAHATFQNLFVEAERCENGLLFRRRSRDGSEGGCMAYVVSEQEWDCECDLEKLTGRMGSLSGNIAENLSRSCACTNNPCAAIRLKLSMKPDAEKCVRFALVSGKMDAEKLRHCIGSDHVQRAHQLSRAYAQTLLRSAGIDARQYGVLQRASAVLLDGGLQKREGRAEPADKRELWKFGISGDLPVLLMEVEAQDQLRYAGQLICAYRFYRLMGVKCDLAFVLPKNGDYLRVEKDGLGDLLSSNGLDGLRNMDGGVHVIHADGRDLALLRRAARINFDGDVFRQLRRLHWSKDADFTGTYRPMTAAKMHTPNLAYFNGYGGFAGGAYVMHIRPDCLPPAPWSNILATDRFGALMTDRGGGFAWYKNSRSGRLTPFSNDVLHENMGWMLMLADDQACSFVNLLPDDIPVTDYIVRFEGGRCVYSGCVEDLDFETEFTVSDEGLQMKIRLRNRGEIRDLRLICAVDWLMGTDADDSALLRTWSKRGTVFASGSAAGVGVLASDGFDAKAEGRRLEIVIKLEKNGEIRRKFLLGCGENIQEAEKLAKDFMRGKALEENAAAFDSILRMETGDDGIDRMVNGFLPAQVLFGRIFGRTGLYQPGGAYGFRDQLQDMLPMIHYDPQRVRRHILYCAARQFAAGDVLHWWHDPYTGVRTKISDDLLFLPFVTAEYVKITGDEDILKEEIPFLENIEIPQGREDIYAQMRPSSEYGSLHEHCMRAFRRAAQTGAHGLCLMGGGDWNDGMDRVGAEGRGESIWLSEFLAVCAANYAEIAQDLSEKAWLMALNERLCAAIEQYGWDGQWYLRAYRDDGGILGGKNCSECQIDAISQAWAVFAGLDTQRTRAAMNVLWDRLADEKLEIIRLLTPPFERGTQDVGYIAAYPPGIRENGAQYTHAACWVVCALARMQDRRAYRALKMLLPLYHADTKEKADVYRVEPYVMAADVYSDAVHAGRGGWSWYTGSAAWMLMAVLELLGYERRGNRVRLNAFLADQDCVSVTVRFATSMYRLECRREARAVTLDGLLADGGWIEMQDDGKEHRAIFPPKNIT